MKEGNFIREHKSDSGIFQKFSIGMLIRDSGKSNCVCICVLKRSLKSSAFEGMRE